MKIIKVENYRGVFDILVDNIFYDFIEYSNSVVSVNKNGYCYIRVMNKRYSLHRFVMNVSSKHVVDHINHNTLDNRKENLRLCSIQENVRNSIKHNSCKTSSKFKGVSFRVGRGLWRAYISFNRKYIHLGHFNNEIDAAIAYNIKARDLFGEFACLNNIPQ